MGNYSVQEKHNIILKNDSQVESFFLTSQNARPGKIYVGSKETNSYIIIDAYWSPLIELLRKTLSVTELAEELSKIDPENFVVEEASSKVKIMLMLFIENRLIHQIDDQLVFGAKRKKTLPIFGSRHFFFFIFTLISLLAILSIFLLPPFFPVPQDFFWSKYFSLCLLSSFLFTWSTALLHEGAHLLIGRVNGIRGRLRMSHRLNFLVLESYFPDIYSLSPKARMAIYISGLVIDFATISCACGLLLFNEQSKIWLLTYLTPLLKQFILLQWLSILWQFFFYMKTDLYFVIKEWIGVDNLYSLSQSRLLKIFHLRKSTEIIPPAENTSVNIYTVFLVIGSVVVLFRYGFYYLPILFSLITHGLAAILIGIQAPNLLSFLDGSTVIVLEGITNLLLAYTLWQSYQQRKLAKTVKTE